MNVKADPLEAVYTLFVSDVEVLDFKDLAPNLRRGLVDTQQDLAPDHEFGQFGRAGVRCLDRRGHFTPPHDADGIGDFHDFPQFVGNQDDGFALALEVFEDSEQVIGFGRCQHACGLVKDQDISLAVQRLEDFDTLLHADADLLDQGIGVDVQFIFFGKFLEFTPCAGEGRA